MLTDVQKAFLVVLLQQFKEGCPHYGKETDAQKAMVDDLINLFAATHTNRGVK
jgi:hypothetical protein